MISDWEIWACARQVVGQYGEDAAFHAGRRADELMVAGDIEGKQTWRRILHRINEFAALPSASDSVS